MLKLLADQFDLRPSQTRMGIVTFSSSPKTILKLEEGAGKDTVNAILSALPIEPGQPNLNNALQRVIRILRDGSEPSRRDVPTKVVVYASDISEGSNEAAALSIDELGRRNAEVVMLMVNDDEKMKEDAISSLPGAVKVVSSTKKGLFGEPFSLLMEKVAKKPGIFRFSLMSFVVA